MALPKSREWLDWLLEGNEPDEEQIHRLVAEVPEEDQWLDYKSGALMADNREAARVLREYAAAFANADGGVLVIGYDHTRNQFDGALAPGGSTLKEWASRSLTGIRSTLPEPRLAVADVEGRKVLLVAVGRGRAVVTCSEKGEPTQYVRMGEQTLRMPQWLVTDLLLGRRTRPILTLHTLRLNPEVVAHPGPMSEMHLRLNVVFENDSFLFARRARAGLVGWATIPAPPSISRRLAASIDASPPTDLAGGFYPWQLLHAMTMRRLFGGTPWIDVLPFDPGTDDLNEWHLPLLEDRGFEVAAALYLLAEDTEPSWWQLTLRYDYRAARLLDEQPDRYIRWEPCVYSRPRVAVRVLAKDEATEL